MGRDMTRQCNILVLPFERVELAGSHLYQGKLRRDKKSIQKHQRQNGDEIEQDRAWSPNFGADLGNRDRKRKVNGTDHRFKMLREAIHKFTTLPKCNQLARPP